MLTRRQLLGGLVSCVPLLFTNQNTKEDFLFNKSLTLVSIKNTTMVMAKYPNEDLKETRWVKNFKFELISLYRNKNNKFDVVLVDRAYIKNPSNVEVFNIDVDNLNLHFYKNPIIDWVKINQENSKHLA